MSRSAVGAELAAWFANNGRHEVPWRSGRTRWEVLVAEVMCCQTQLDRVVQVLGPFLAAFPTEHAAAAAGQGALVAAWGNLGYPRRARSLYEAACTVSATGWPDDLEALPGVGPWVAAAVAAQADDADAFACDVNIRRLAQRVCGENLTDRVLVERVTPLLEPMRGRARLLAVLDAAAIVCTRRDPRCAHCPFETVCATHGPLDGETAPARQSRYEGSLRQRRGAVLAAVRSGPVPLDELPADAVASLVVDRLVRIDGDVATLA